MEFAITSITSLVAVIGALAFMVSIITQVFKGVGVLSKVPTDILVFVLSIGLTFRWLLYGTWLLPLSWQDLSLRLLPCTAGRSFPNCGNDLIKSKKGRVSCILTK